MDQNTKTVSIRLAKADYDALRAMAQESYNTMSGVIRRLIGRETGKENEHEKRNGQAE